MRERAGRRHWEHVVSTEGGYHCVRAARAAISGVPADTQSIRYGATAAAEIQGTLRQKTKTRQQQRGGHGQRSLEEGQKSGREDGDRLEVESTKRKTHMNCLTNLFSVIKGKAFFPPCQLLVCRKKNDMSSRRF